MGSEQNKTVVSPYVIHVFVRGPNGAPIPGANVKFSSQGNPYDGLETTGLNGLAELALYESDFGDGVSSTGAAEVNIEAGKRHFGPMIAKGADFKNGPVKATVLDQRIADPPYSLKGAPASGQSEPGTPNVKVVDVPVVDTTGKQLQNKKNQPLTESLWALEVVLMEAGPVGTNPRKNLNASDPLQLVRRLSSLVDDQGKPGQVQEELIYGIAQGDIVLTPESGYSIQHSTGGDDYAPCIAGQCKFNPGSESKKVSLQGNSLAQVDFLHILDFSNSMNTITWKPAAMNNLNQRHVVGVTRLCRMLRDERSVAAIYTQGFITTGADAHEHGRAMDFSGAALAKPEARTQAIRPEIDLIISYHWGNVKMLVQKLDGSTVRREEDKGTYHAENDTRPPNEDLLCRLDPEPQPNERSSATKDLPQSHFTKAKEVFVAAYQVAIGQY